MATRSEPFSGCQLEPKGSRVKLSLKASSWLLPSRLSLSLPSGARVVMGKRKAMERDVLPLPLPSPPAPAARVTRRRLGTSQGGGGQVYFANAADGFSSFATTVSGEWHTKKLFWARFWLRAIQRCHQTRIKPPPPHCPINVPLSKKQWYNSNSKSNLKPRSRLFSRILRYHLNWLLLFIFGWPGLKFTVTPTFTKSFSFLNPVNILTF